MTLFSKQNSKRWHDREDQPFNLKWTKQPTRTLGIFVSYDKHGTEQKNFNIKTQNLIPVLTFGDLGLSVYLEDV